jgi:drug/metabolite transporter (DMT)-like permease
VGRSLVPSRRFFAYAAIYLFWGASFLAIREIVEVTPPFLAAGFRFTAAGLILLALSVAQRVPWPSGRELRSAAMLGLVFFSVNYACVFWAEQRVASGYAAVVSSTQPVWIFAGEWLWLRAVRPTGAGLIGMALGMAGVVLLVLPSVGDGSLTAGLAVLFGAFCWCFGTLWSRRLTVPKSRYTNAGLQMFLGGAVLLAASALADEMKHLPDVLAHWNLRLSLDMAYLVVAASILAFLAFIWLIDHEPASRVSSYAYVNPLIAVALGAMVGGERLAPVQLAGAACVLSGVVITLRSRRVSGG